MVHAGRICGGDHDRGGQVGAADKYSPATRCLRICRRYFSGDANDEVDREICRARGEQK